MVKQGTFCHTEFVQQHKVRLLCLYGNSTQPPKALVRNPLPSTPEMVGPRSHRENPDSPTPMSRHLRPPGVPTQPHPPTCSRVADTCGCVPAPLAPSVYPYAQ